MDQRASVNSIERANLVSFNTMGASQYLGLIRQRGQAQAVGNENIDEGAEEEAQEQQEENMDVDSEVDSEAGASTWRTGPIRAFTDVIAPS